MNRSCGFLAAALLSFCACAHAPLLPPAPLPLSVAPFQIRVKIRRLKYIHEAPKNLPRADEPKLIQEEMSRVSLSLAESFSQKLSSAGFNVASLPTLPTGRQAGQAGSTVAPALCLETAIEAYGRVPGKWLAFLLGSGAVEGTVQGAALATAAGTAWAGIGIGLEEVVQETTMWGGGTFFTNRYLIPVILSCRIVRESDHKTLWSDHEISLYSRRIVKSLPLSERGLREAQLAAVADHSLDKLVHSIQKVWPKIIKRRLAQGGA